MPLLETLNAPQGLTERERDIARYLLEHPEQVEHFSARELGAATFTSAASVTRFCQKLGFKGYPDFKLRFVSELQEARTRRPEEAPQLRQRESALTLVRKVTEVARKAVEETNQQLSLEQLIRVSTLLQKAECLDFYAYDTVACLAEYACSQFYFAGKRAQVYTAANTQGFNALLPAKGHVAILISHTGEDARLAALAGLLHRQGTPVVVIANGAACTLATLADEFLCAATSHKTEEFRVSMFASSAKYLLDLLFSLVFSHNYDANIHRNQEYEVFGRAHLWSLVKDV
ncbi:MAG: MurR/RpiR family transcriptional regulator [Gemmiger sp.]|nr:MurR/RpiR family transcriptional regulator [Gemmiger sp.]